MWYERINVWEPLLHSIPYGKCGEANAQIYGISCITATVVYLALLPKKKGSNLDRIAGSAAANSIPNLL